MNREVIAPRTHAMFSSEKGAFWLLSRQNTLSYLSGLLRASGLPRGLPFSTYAPRWGGWGQASYTFPLGITCKKGVGGSR